MFLIRVDIEGKAEAFNVRVCALPRIGEQAIFHVESKSSEFEVINVTHFLSNDTEPKIAITVREI